MDIMVETEEHTSRNGKIFQRDSQWSYPFLARGVPSVTCQGQTGFPALEWMDTHTLQPKLLQPKLLTKVLLYIFN